MSYDDSDASQIDWMAVAKGVLAKLKSARPVGEDTRRPIDQEQQAESAPTEVCIHLPPNLAIMLHLFAAVGFGVWRQREWHHIESYLRDASKLFESGFADERELRLRMSELVYVVPDAGPGGWDAAHSILAGS